MRAAAILTSVTAVVAASLGVVASAQAEPDPVVLQGHVVDASGKPLQGVAVRCDTDGRPGPFVVTGTDAEGDYSFTRRDFDDAVKDDPYTGCDHLWFFDPAGRYITTSYPSGDGAYAGDPVELPPREGGEPTVADGTLGRAGQLVGSATDAKKRGLFDVRVDVLSAKTRKVVASVQTSPYGGYRVLGLRPDSYKVRVGTDTAAIGYRFAYAGGGSTFDRAKTVKVKAGASTTLARQTVPNTRKLFTSRSRPSLTYARPLVSGSKVTLGASAFTSTPKAGSTRFVVASRAVDPTTGDANDALPYAKSVWDYVYGDDAKNLVLKKGTFTGFIGDYVFESFAGRRFVVVAVHARRGYAQTSAPSLPTDIAQ